ncbi:hypothetical protein PHISCL_10484 [Aspergillus sclerotialis]|uniref:Uncharacterized protein n=1 Tax=Aspergillus sclerotialis TaxID=2070753 RepID=A0A3A2Z2D3_9EURO|nr:hypothetical protein PHISCL_10484 [Aspergillus sclerotialis]
MTVFVGDGVYDGEGVQFLGLDFTLFAKHLVSADHRIWDRKQNMEGLSFMEKLHCKLDLKTVQRPRVEPMMSIE